MGWNFSHPIGLAGLLHFRALPTGVETLGVGFGGNLSDILFSVNGGTEIAVSSDPNYVNNNLGRNAYVTVQTEPGDPLITSFTYRVSLNNNDWTNVDHIAFGSAAVPEVTPLAGWSAIFGVLLITHASQRWRLLLKATRFWR